MSEQTAVITKKLTLCLNKLVGQKLKCNSKIVPCYMKMILAPPIAVGDYIGAIEDYSGGITWKNSEFKLSL